MPTFLTQPVHPAIMLYVQEARSYNHNKNCSNTNSSWKQTELRFNVIKFNVSNLLERQTHFYLAFASARDVS